MENASLPWTTQLPPTARYGKGGRKDAVYKAWKLLSTSGAADPTACKTFNYDVVNTGREVMAQIITIIEGNLTAAVSQKKRSAVDSASAALLDAYADLDELLGE
jgi:hypothetical protein